QFRVAERAKSKLKTLGIDLDKNSYSYGEIKQFHPSDNLPLILRALDEGDDSKMLAKPNLRVLEGEEAKVTIGDRIPLEVAATAQTDSGSVLKLNAQLSWVDVGIKMTVKNVEVNPDGSIRMGLKGEVSSVISTTKQGYPQIRTREAESMLRVANGGCVIMGGLLNQEERETQNKIPLIGNIPLFGGLARSRDRQHSATEIIMVVTARVAKD
ncbi:MAG: type II and III secretion system protein, partial [Candidatus Riflebacteria bacterium]|nr:type II and III secretion system protein [Candidatus Riflebacteria bacterium]